MKDFTIVTRSKSYDLAEKAQEFLNPIAKEKIIMQHNFLKGRSYYVQFIDEALFMVELFNLNGWVIHIDEDAYCWDVNEIIRIRKHMEKENIQIAGAICRNVDPVSINPFFMIINMDEIEGIGVEDAPNNYYKLENIKYDSHYLFFLWLEKNGTRFLYLEDEGIDINSEVNINLEEEDNIKLEINPSILHGIEKPFLIHSWNARFYYRDSKIRRKIDYCYNYARNRR